MTTAFLDATLVCPNGGVRRGDLLVIGDTIVAIGSFDLPSDANVVTCGGRTLAPAIVDFGVFHVDRDACKRGGVVRVALMPDQSPLLDVPGVVQRAALVGKPDLWIHPIAAATQGLGGIDLAEMAMCARAGARAVGTGRKWIGDSGVMRRVLSYARDLDLSAVVHSEDAFLVADAVATDGETATRLGLASAPAIAESLSVARDLMLAEETGARLHFRQLTTAASFDLVRSAKRRGVAVTCGVTPAYLHLSDIAMSDFRTFAHLSPPLRCEADRQATLAAVADGTVDVLASGHDPHGPEEKRLPFADAAAGMAGTETLLALALMLVRDGQLTLDRLFALLARNPLKVLGIEGGTLEQGSPADLVLFDADVPWQIDGEKFSSAGNTPFDGLPVQGRVIRLWKGGREI